MPEAQGETTTTFFIQGSSGCELQISAKVFGEAGDDFSRLRRSTYVFVERQRTNAREHVIKRVADHVLRSELILGLVAKPAFNTDERFTPIVYALAEAIDGLLFNRDEFLDATGKVLLNCDVR